MRLALALSAVVALGLASPAYAQDGVDKTRLDEFAIPVSDAAGPPIEQLGDRADSLTPLSQPAADHEVAVPGPAPAERAPVAQISRPGQDTPAQQLSERGEARQLAAGAVSSSSDSRPRATGPIGGSDRCDPQLESERFEECLRVLELRAAEFSAPEAPKLSAEQVLLAERGSDSERLASRSSDLRLKLAAGDPDAEIASNQELASIYLDRARAEGQPVPAPEGPPTDEAKLAEVLQGLQIDLSGVTAP